MSWTPPDRTEKERAILDASMSLFVERGFHGTAVPLIAKRASVGAGTIYRYFESKEALVNALYQEWKGRLLAQMFEGFPQAAPPREQFRHFWMSKAEFTRKYPLAMAFMELSHHANYLDDESLKLEERGVVLSEAVLRGWQARQAIKNVEPQMLLAVVLGIFVGVVRWGSQHGVSLTNEHFEAAQTCAWEAIRA